MLTGSRAWQCVALGLSGELSSQSNLWDVIFRRHTEPTETFEHASKTQLEHDPNS